MKSSLTLLFLATCFHLLVAQTADNSNMGTASGEEIFTEVDLTPKFPGCEGDPKEGPLKNCSDKTMLFKLLKEISYPARARELGVTGTVVATFIVEKDGRISQAEIKKGIGSGCDESVLLAVNAMNDLGIVWIPGQKNGKIVRSQMDMPFKFDLE